MPSSVAHYSVACKSFCEWVLAIERYAVAYKMVEPKRKAYEDVKLKLRSIKSQLFTKEEQMKRVIIGYGNILCVELHIVYFIVRSDFISVARII